MPEYKETKVFNQLLWSKLCFCCYICRGVYRAIVRECSTITNHALHICPYTLCCILRCNTKSISSIVHELEVTFNCRFTHTKDTILCVVSRTIHSYNIKEVISFTWTVKHTPLYNFFIHCFFRNSMNCSHVKLPSATLPGMLLLLSSDQPSSFRTSFSVVKSSNRNVERHSIDLTIYSERIETSINEITCINISHFKNKTTSYMIRHVTRYREKVRTFAHSL